MYCTEDENGENKLGLWHMTSLEEMVVGKWNIFEPPKELWGNPEKEVTPQELDMIMVPGTGLIDLAEEWETAKDTMIEQWSK